MDLKKIFSKKEDATPPWQSKTLQVVLIVLGVLIILLFVFKLGVLVGFKKASYSYRWGENYHRNFAGPRHGFFRSFTDKDYINAHGTFGSIMQINGDTLVVRGRDDIEKTVLLSDETVIKRYRKRIKLTELAVDDRVVIIGSPDGGGQIQAKLIRVFR